MKFTLTSIYLFVISYFLSNFRKFNLKTKIVLLWFTVNEIMTNVNFSNLTNKWLQELLLIGFVSFKVTRAHLNSQKRQHNVLPWKWPPFHYLVGIDLVTVKAPNHWFYRIKWPTVRWTFYLEDAGWRVWNTRASVKVVNALPLGRMSGVFTGRASHLWNAYDLLPHRIARPDFRVIERP